MLTPLTFARHRLSPLVAFTSGAYFTAVESGDSEFANFTLPTLKAFLEARGHDVSGNNCSCYRMPQNAFFFYELAIFWSAKKRRKDFISTLYPLSTVFFTTATVLAFILLRDSRSNFHCHTQREATPTQKSARKCAATSRDTLRERLQSPFTLANQFC